MGRCGSRGGHRSRRARHAAVWGAGWAAADGDWGPRAGRTRLVLRYAQEDLGRRDAAGQIERDTAKEFVIGRERRMGHMVA